AHRSCEPPMRVQLGTETSTRFACGARASSRAIAPPVARRVALLPDRLRFRRMVDMENPTGPRLWLVTASLQAGGAERQITQMANYWSAKGLSVTVASWSGPDVPDFYALDERVRRVHMDVAPAGHAPLARIRLNLRRIAKLRRLL